MIPQNQTTLTPWIVAEPDPVTTEDQPLTPFGQAFKAYLTGMTLYDRGEPYCACQNEKGRQGWTDALNAEAEADMPTYNAYGDRVIGC